MCSTTCRREQQAWLLQAAVEVWEGFKTEFQQLWHSPARAGDAHPLSMYSSADGSDPKVPSHYWLG